MTANDYEIVIGLEVHVELKTKTKIYCGCTTEFGGEPNTHCCPVCTGMPGTLPVLNKEVVDFAIKAGLATNCKINQYSKQDRKNYFYPDLPKAYQTSQYDLPLCYGGYIDIEEQDQTKRIGLTRIHIEEDAGKLIHTEQGTLVDYNRCGVPLIEIVSEPDLRNPEQIRSFLTKLRTIILYTGISDCKMNEGSFRCDVNLSVRKKGSSEFGTRTEMKNINSFHFAVKAAEYEAKRQIKVLTEGGQVVQETRRWDEAKGVTVSMRSKEEAHDYRYFPAPDLMPIVTDDQKLEAIRRSIPELPEARKNRYMNQDKLSAYDADLLIASKQMSDYFDQASQVTGNKKGVANIIISEAFSRLNEQQKEEAAIPIPARHIGKLMELVDQNIISSSIAKKVFDAMWEEQIEPEQYIKQHQLGQINDQAALTEMAQQVVDNNAKIVSDYLAGKKSAIGALVGQMMKQTKGKANPQKVNQILIQLIEAGNEK